jgi:hypothetical protein
MKRMLLGLAWAGGYSLLGLACGGNVIVDAPGGGGAGGSGSPASNTTTGSSGQGGASMVTVGPGPGPGPGPATISVTAVGPAQVVSSSTGGPLCDNTGDCSGCQSCAVEKPCAAQWDQCVTQTSCSSMLACFNSCNNGDQMCYSECYNKFPDAQQLYEDLALCVLCDACYVDCNGLGAGC